MKMTREVFHSSSSHFARVATWHCARMVYVYNTCCFVALACADMTSIGSARDQK